MGAVQKTLDTAEPARIARSARRLIQHLPQDWPWEATWTDLLSTVSRPPPQPAIT